MTNKKQNGKPKRIKMHENDKKCDANGNRKNVQKK